MLKNRGEIAKAEIINVLQKYDCAKCTQLRHNWDAHDDILNCQIIQVMHVLLLKLL